MERLSPLSRRRVIVSGLGFAALGAGGPAWARTLIATPPQTAGPFYPSIKPVVSPSNVDRRCQGLSEYDIIGVFQCVM